MKQLIELMFDVEQQLVRADQIGTQYGGQAGTATSAYGNTAQYTGRRMGSLSSFAGTQSFNTTAASGNVGITTNVNNASMTCQLQLPTVSLLTATAQHSTLAHLQTSSSAQSSTNSW